MRPIQRSDTLIMLSLVVAFCLVGIATLDHYGLTYDETWHMFAGKRYLRFWTTLDGSLLDFFHVHPLDHGNGQEPLFDLPFASRPFPPVGSTLSAISSWLFFAQLKWLDAVDAHHLPILLMGGGTLAVTYLLGREGIGQRAAVFATLALGLSPRFIAHSHFNVKDVPKTFFFALAIWTFWRAVTRRSWRWLIAAAVAVGLALGTRINAVLIPVILAPWLGALVLRTRGGPWAWPRRWWWALAASPAVAALTWTLVWPSMIVAPLKTVANIVSHWRYLGFGAHSLRTWSPYALIYTAVVTPPVTFLLASLGIVVAAREWWGKAQHMGLLLLIWVAVPVLRTAVPNATNYDGIRQFIEFLPAFCLLGGLGAQRLLEALEEALPRGLPTAGDVAFLACAFVPLVFRIAQIHPHELAYFNAFVGGLPGARRINLPDATDYWGSSHRQGIAWLNANAEVGAYLYVGPGNVNMVKPVGDIWLRDDIELLADDLGGSDIGSPVYVSHITRPGLYGDVDRYCEVNLQPVHTIDVDGVPILKIFRLEPAQWKDMQIAVGRDTESRRPGARGERARPAPPGEARSARVVGPSSRGRLWAMMAV